MQVTRFINLFRYSYPILNYVSYDQFSSEHKAYLVAIASHEEPHSYSKFVQRAKWCESNRFQMDTQGQVQSEVEKYKAHFMRTKRISLHAYHSLFIYSRESSFLAIMIYVDDLVVGNDAFTCAKFKQYLNKCFHMKYLGALKYFLGIKLTYGEFSLFTCY
ncbi:hypothetical protein CR513_07595, partial [Mucuna pruriens]